MRAISGRAVRRPDMLIVPGGGDLDGVRVVAGGESGICAAWGFVSLLLDDVDVGADGCWLVGEISEGMTGMTFCSTSAELGFGGSEFSVDISLFVG